LNFTRGTDIPVTDRQRERHTTTGVGVKHDEHRVVSLMTGKVTVSAE